MNIQIKNGRLIDPKNSIDAVCDVFIAAGRIAATGAAPKGFVAAMGMPIREDGVNEGENLTLACRNALLNLIDLLQERGWTREQAYVLCSVAADLRVSNVVDVPNYVVSALIPEAIFTG